MPATVVKIGGCNGSGKTSLVRGVMYLCGELIPIYQKGKRPEAYQGAYKGLPVYVLGSYETTCGGMDTISDKNVRLGLVKKYSAKEGLVLFEGLITGKTYGAMGVLSEKQRGRWVYVFMNTPFDVCVARVLKRRAAAGNGKDFDPFKTMEPTFKSCLATAKRAQAEGHKVMMVRHDIKSETIAKLLLEKVIEFHNAR